MAGGLVSLADRARRSFVGYGLAEVAVALDGSAAGTRTARRLLQAARGGGSIAARLNHERAEAALAEFERATATEYAERENMDREWLKRTDDACPKYERCQVPRGHGGACDPRTEEQRAGALFAVLGKATERDLASASAGLVALLRWGRLPDHQRGRVLALLGSWSDSRANRSRAARVVVREWPGERQPEVIDRALDFWGEAAAEAEVVGPTWQSGIGPSDVDTRLLRSLLERGARCT